MAGRRRLASSEDGRSILDYLSVVVVLVVAVAAAAAVARKRRAAIIMPRLVGHGCRGPASICRQSAAAPPARHAGELKKKRRRLKRTRSVSDDPIDVT